MMMTKRILVIDDEPHLRQGVMDTLTYLGYEVIGASDGRNGLALAIEQHPDLIITDVVMPNMDGYEMLSQMRRDPRTKSIPVIFLSAVGECQAKQRCLNLGASRYVLKPFVVEELLTAVQTQIVA
jgi:CheY-like chemotaxis protein